MVNISELIIFKFLLFFLSTIFNYHIEKNIKLSDKSKNIGIEISKAIKDEAIPDETIIKVGTN